MGTFARAPTKIHYKMQHNLEAERIGLMQTKHNKGLAIKLLPWSQLCEFPPHKAKARDLFSARASVAKS